MTHRIVAWAQIVITLVFLVGYFWTLHDFIHGNIKASVEWQDTIKVLLGVLTTNIPLLMAYWFQRQRESKDPAS